MSNTNKMNQAQQAPTIARGEEGLLCVIDSQGDRILDLIDAANMSVTAVLKANLSPYAFAMLERFLTDLREDVGSHEVTLLDLLDTLCEPDTQRVMRDTLDQALSEDTIVSTYASNA